MQTEILRLCTQLVGSTVNGVYQGIVVAAFVALALRLFGRTNAATRHAIWFCTLLLLVSLLIAHCFIGPVLLSPGISKIDVASASNLGLEPISPATHVPPSLDGGTAADSSVSIAALGNLTPSSEEIGDAPDSPPLPISRAVGARAHRNHLENLTAQHERPDELGKAASNDEKQGGSVPGEATGFRWLGERLVNPVSLKLALGSKIPRWATMSLLALWLTIAGFKLLALLLQLGGIQKLKRQSFPPSAELSELFQRLAAHLDVNRKVELKISPAQRSSFLLGFLQPVVLLPAAERLEQTETELVLRHELAHLRRYDDWANLFQHLILAVFFFHPAVWWISRRLSLEREIACDDHVLQQSGRPQAYARLLANLAARMQRGLPQLAPGASNNKTQLKERIDMILNTNRNTSPRLAKTWLAFITATVALIIITIISSAPRIVLAQAETVSAAVNAPPADVPQVTPPSESEIASGALAPDAPDSLSADPTYRTTPPPGSVGAGPKFKPGSSGDQNPPRDVLVTPSIAFAPTPIPTIIAAPLPPPVLAAIEPAPEAQAPRPPRPARAPRSESQSSSLEGRLERLEQMVDSLLNQQNPKGHVDFNLKAEKDWMIDRKEIAKIEAFAKQQAELSHNQSINPKEIERAKVRAERDAERVADQVKSIAADIEKTMKAGQERQTSQKLEKESLRQLEVLRKQREILERQTEKLDHQIEQLEQAQEELEEQRNEARTGGDTQLDNTQDESDTKPSAVP